MQSDSASVLRVRKVNTNCGTNEIVVSRPAM
jgi:hypothetical protein